MDWFQYFYGLILLFIAFLIPYTIVMIFIRMLWDSVLSIFKNAMY